MKQSLIIALFTTLTISISFHSLTSEEGTVESYNVEVIHTSTKQIVKLSSNDLELLTVPDSFQFNQYSSGQCCLEAIFNYYQFPSSPSPYREDFFMDIKDFDENNFTSPENLIKAAQRKLNNESSQEKRRAFGLILQQNMEASILERTLSLQIPVILLVSKKGAKTGSYIIAIGVDSNNYYFQDPLKIGSIAYLPKNELSTYWQAYIRSEYRWANQLGIIITYNNGRKRETPPTIRPLP